MNDNIKTTSSDPVEILSTSRTERSFVGFRIIACLLERHWCTVKNGALRMSFNDEIEKLFETCVCVELF